MAGESGSGPRVRYVTVEPVLFLYMLALYLTVPANQQLTFMKFCRRTYLNDSAVCNNNTITGSNINLQTDTAHLNIYSTAATVVPLVLSCTFLGSWSDKRGRKWPQLMPILGAALANGFNALLSVYIDWHPALIIVSSIIQGLSGYFAGIMLTCYSYLTAIASKEKLTLRIAIAEGIMSLGLLAGSLLSGISIDKLGLTWNYVVVASIYVISALYLVLWLPNIRPPEKEDADEQGQGHALCSCSTLVDYAKCVFKRRDGNNRMYLHLSLTSFFFGFCTIAGATEVLFLFLTKVHKFSSSVYGFYTGLDIGLKLIIGSSVLALIRRRLKWEDLSAAMVGCASGVLGYSVIGVSVSDWMLWLGPAINSLNFFYSVTLRSFISQLVSRDEQGRIFAFMATGQSVFTFLSSVVFNSVYPLSLSFYPGLCFIMAAFLSLVAFSILAFLSAHRNRYSGYEELSGVN